jgi:hypothetical protein
MVGVGGLLGAGAYFARHLLVPDPGPHLLERVVGGGSGHVVLGASERTRMRGVHGLVWDGGWAMIGDVISDAHGVVRRPILAGGRPPAGAAAAVEGNVWVGDPRTAHGLGFLDVHIDGPLGPMPAWLVPAKGAPLGAVLDGVLAGHGEAPDAPSEVVTAMHDQAADVLARRGSLDGTWVIMVHGRSNTRAETMRPMAALHRLGFSLLAVSYRNDHEAPASPDGLYHLGDTEWSDLEAAVGWAVAHGAEQIVLFGWSMGGAVVEAFLHRSDLLRYVAAVVLDAPVLDWRETLRLASAVRRLPDPVTQVAERVAGYRIGIRWDDFDVVGRAGGRNLRTLILHGTQDRVVPLRTSELLAERHPLSVRLEVFPDAAHCRGWNVERRRYEAVLAEFLAPYRPGAAPFGPGALGQSGPL